MISKKFFLFFLISIVLILSIYNFYLSMNNLDVSWDGFVYLSMAKYKTNPRFQFDPIRSSFIAYILGPSIYGVRIEMIFLFVCSTVLVFLISEQIYKDIKKSFLSTLFFGTYWYLIHFEIYALIEIPSLFFFLIAIYFATLISKNLKLPYGYISGVFAGLSFSIRFLMIPLIGALIYYVWKKGKSQSTKKFLVSFLFIVGILLYISSYSFYGKRFTSISFFDLNKFYSPAVSLYNWMTKFVKEMEIINVAAPPYYYLFALFETNPILTIVFLISLAWSIYKRKNIIFLVFAVVLILPLSFLPGKELRWIIPSMPFICMIAGEILDPIKRLSKIIEKNSKKYFNHNRITIFIFAILTISYILYNTYILTLIEYPELDLDKIEDQEIDFPYKFSHFSCSSNYPLAVTYFLMPCQNVFWKQGSPDFSLQTAINMIDQSYYFILFEPKKSTIEWFNERYSHNYVYKYVYYVLPSKRGFSNKHTSPIKTWANENLDLINKIDIGSFMVFIYS